MSIKKWRQPATASCYQRNVVLNVFKCVYHRYYMTHVAVLCGCCGFNVCVICKSILTRILQPLRLDRDSRHVYVHG